jgi:uncharacterized protein YndB with AHSA1/START domain
VEPDGVDLDRERLGIASIDQGEAELAFERVIDAPLERVWAALSDADEIAAWMFAVRVEFEPGRRLVIHWADGSQIGGAIVGWDPPRTLAFEWDDGHGPSTVRFDLDVLEGGTRLRLTHRRLPAGDAPGTLTGWHSHLIALDDHLRGRAMAYEPVFDALAPRYGARAHREYVEG